MLYEMLKDYQMKQVGEGMLSTMNLAFYNGNR